MQCSVRTVKKEQTKERESVRHTAIRFSNVVEYVVRFDVRSECALRMCECVFMENFMLFQKQLVMDHWKSIHHSYCLLLLTYVVYLIYGMKRRINCVSFLYYT